MGFGALALFGGIVVFGDLLSFLFARLVQCISLVGFPGFGCDSL